MAKVFDFARHVVTEIVKAEFVVRSVGDVGEISVFTGRRAEVAKTFVVMFLVIIVFVIDKGSVVDDDANRKPKKIINWAVPTSVALGKIVVHGDDVDTATGQSVQNGRPRRSA